MSAELKEGYKQTEVGVIPEDWEVKRLREISPSQSVGLVINPSTYTDPDGTVVMLVGSDILPNKINWLNSRKITAESNDKLHASKIYSDDLVVMRVGEPGITAVVPPVLNGSNCASVMIVRRSNKFVSNWLAYLMNSEFGLKTIETIQYGTAQKCFNISDAANFQYPTPPLPEQKAIASALVDVDALLASLETLLTKKRQLKQAAMQELLTGKTRLEGFGGAWEEHSLASVCSLPLSYGINAPATRYSDDLPIYVRITDIEEGRLRKTGQMSVNHISADKYLLEQDDILLARTGASVGKSYRHSNDESAKYVYAGFLIRARPDTRKISPLFLSAILNTKNFWDWVILMSQRSGQPGINSKEYGSLLFFLPPLVEQEAIAFILSEIDAELEALEGRVAKTRDLKQGMMQELLTGRTRLL